MSADATLDVVVSGTESDSHTWNLVFLQLLLEDWGHRVENLGPCLTGDELAAACRKSAPDLIVLSSVNGHGESDGLRAVAALRACAELADTPVVIGGKLGTGRQLQGGAGTGGRRGVGGGHVPAAVGGRILGGVPRPSEFREFEQFFQLVSAAKRDRLAGRTLEDLRTTPAS
ncbi:methylaspartate mutase [Streptacidiphilus sp. 4-A2]|nr:methylaspartate mutase [Streptacidiphilus sp. 4-A2]